MAYLTPEMFDGEGDDDYSEDILIKQTGRIRTRDKSIDGTQSKRKTSRSVCRPVSGQFAKEQASRLETHRRRILAREAALREGGINPYHAGSAGESDDLAN